MKKLFYNEDEIEDAKTACYVSGFVGGCITAIGVGLISAVVMVQAFPLEWAKLTWWLFTLK